jgi:hypothetical protein
VRTEADGTVTYFPLDQPTSEVAVGWYMEMGTPEQTGNTMAMVFRDGPDRPWKLVMRTRIYLDDKIGAASKDRRQGFMVTAEPDDDPETARTELVEKADGLFQDLLGLGLGKLYRVADHTSLQDFFRIWGEQPWAHMRVETPEERARRTT